MQVPMTSIITNIKSKNSPRIATLTYSHFGNPDGSYPCARYIIEKLVQCFCARLYVYETLILSIQKFVRKRMSLLRKVIGKKCLIFHTSGIFNRPNVLYTLWHLAPCLLMIWQMCVFIISTLLFCCRRHPLLKRKSTFLKVRFWLICLH